MKLMSFFVPFFIFANFLGFKNSTTNISKKYQKRGVII